MSFESIKSIMSDCICRTVTMMEQKIDSETLNRMSNEYADKFLEKMLKTEFKEKIGETREYLQMIRNSKKKIDAHKVHIKILIYKREKKIQ